MRYITGYRIGNKGRKIAMMSLWAVAVVLIGATSLVMALRYCGFELLSVQTDSMAPTIRAGEAVMLVVSDRDIKVGEVVSFTSLQNRRVIVTHRVVSVDWKGGTFIARGDNNDMTDRPVPLQNLVGTVHRAVPFAGYPLDALRHPLGIIVAVYVPALGIIAAEVRRLAMHFSGKNPQRHIRYVIYARM